MLQLKRANALSRSQQMAAITLTIIILLNYLAFYYAYGAFEGSVGTKKRDFFHAKNPVDVHREVVQQPTANNTHITMAAAARNGPLAPPKRPKISLQRI